MIRQKFSSTIAFLIYIFIYFHIFILGLCVGGCVCVCVWGGGGGGGGEGLQNAYTPRRYLQGLSSIKHCFYVDYHVHI